MKSNDSKITLIVRDTKEKLRETLLEDKKSIEALSQTDASHSAAYYFSLFRLIDDFVRRLDEAILFNKLEPGWQYGYDISFEGISLYVEHLVYVVDDEDGFPIYDHDVLYVLFTVPARFLTVEEYAKQYNVAVGTVKQWIRRAKIRTAKKYGTEWKISELTDPPKRGYTDGHYKWTEPLSYLPYEYSYLKGHCEIHIAQSNEDKQKFIVSLLKDEGCLYFEKEREITTPERERLELFLIGNPEIRVCQNFTDAPVWDLVRYHNQQREEANND